MKKLLSLLSAVSLTAISASSVIACSDEKRKQVKQHPPKEQTPVVDTQSPAISEQQQTPVVDTQSPAISEQQQTPVVDTQSPAISEQQQTPVVDTQSPAISEQQQTPVVDTQSPAISEQQQTPVVDTQSPAISEQQQTPVVDTQSPAISEQQQTPVVDTQTIMNISLSSMKKVGDRKVRGVPYLNFKLPINLYNNLEIDTLIRKTQEEKTIIFNNVESFIKNFVKEKIHEKILKINNSLTKKDYNIIFLYPDIMRIYNPRYKCITLDFIVEGKNKATGQVTQKLTVDVSTYGNTY